MQVPIILFCIWHMFTIFIYSVPRDAKDGFAVGSRALLLPIVTPYLFATSQWQLWNLFSPDPLSSITEYRIDVNKNGTWQTITTITPDSFPWWLHADEFKMFTNVFGNDGSAFAPAKERILTHLSCESFALPPGTPVRLFYKIALIPGISYPRSSAWWSMWQPEWKMMSGPTIRCPLL